MRLLSIELSRSRSNLNVYYSFEEGEGSVNWWAFLNSREDTENTGGGEER